MKNIFKMSSLLIGVLLADTKLSTLSACTDQEMQEYQACQQSCVNSGSGYIGCSFGCWIYGMIFGCLTGSGQEMSQSEEVTKFKKYLGDKLTKMQGKKYTSQDFINLYEEYKKFEKSEKENKNDAQDNESASPQKEEPKSSPATPENSDMKKKAP